MSKKVIIIGSGFGGLAAALRLRAKNYKVTLLEKHSDLGGRARVLILKGQFHLRWRSYSNNNCTLLASRTIFSI